MLLILVDATTANSSVQNKVWALWLYFLSLAKNLLLFSSAFFLCVFHFCVQVLCAFPGVVVVVGNIRCFVGLGCWVWFAKFLKDAHATVEDINNAEWSMWCTFYFCGVAAGGVRLHGDASSDNVIDFVEALLVFGVGALTVSGDAIFLQKR